MSLARVVAPGFEYRLTDEDVLWACRMVIGEGPDDAACVLWTMTQRFYRVHSATYDTFTKLIQAYCQPINPKWRRDGSKCRDGGPFHGRDACSEHRLERRDWLAGASIEELKQKDETAIATVYRWAEGKLPNPVPGAVHFAVKKVVLNNHLKKYPQYGEGRDSRLVKAIGGNWFIALPKTVNWEATRVQMVVDQAPVTEELSDEQAQWILVALGYDLGEYGPLDDGVDGDWGLLSRTAIEEFQQARDLPVDGERDRRDDTELNQAYSEMYHVVPNYDASAVTWRAKRVNTHPDPAPIGVPDAPGIQSPAADEYLASLGTRRKKYEPRTSFSAVVIHTTGDGPIRRWKREKNTRHKLDTPFETAVRRIYHQIMFAGPHYVVGQKGECVQVCPEELAAWHVSSKRARYYRRPDWVESRYEWWAERWLEMQSPHDFAGGMLWHDSSCNANSVGIEVVPPTDNPRGAWSEECVAKLKQLIADICERRDIPADKEHVVTHSDADPISRTTEGGDPWDPNETQWPGLTIIT